VSYRQQQAEEKAREQQKTSDILNNSLSYRSKCFRKGGSGEDDIDFKPTTGSFSLNFIDYNEKEHLVGVCCKAISGEK